jgi:hypothetical protein
MKAKKFDDHCLSFYSLRYDYNPNDLPLSHFKLSLNYSAIIAAVYRLYIGNMAPILLPHCGNNKKRSNLASRR